VAFLLCAWCARRIDPAVLRIGFGVMVVVIGIYAVVSTGKLVR
jgi:uncharacterized membrane protein YfcA